MDVTSVSGVLASLGLLPVILLAATIGLASLLFRLFTRGAGGGSAEYHTDKYEAYADAARYGVSREEVDANFRDAYRNAD